MIYKSILFIAVIIIFCSNSVNAELDEEGNNVCFKNVKKNQTIQVKYTQPIEVDTFKFCPKFPFSCKVKKTEYRLAVRPENRTIVVKVAYCCEGYYQDGEKCRPFCSNSCVHGECSAPNVCDCQLGSGGPSCNITCPPNKFGSTCEYDCSCLLKPHCNSNYRDCSCLPGEISTECKNICKCKSSVCPPGLIGKNCEASCPLGTFGSMCIGKCLCNEQNTSECNKETGDCKCKNSFYGVFCEHECTGELICEGSSNCKCKIEGRSSADKNIDASTDSLAFKRDPNLTDSKNNHGLIFSLIALLVVIISLSMVSLYRYKMKTKKLKRDLKNIQVRYSTGGSSDQFDNPVYSYSTNQPYNCYPASTITGSNYAGSNYNASQYAPSTIQTTTLPHRPKHNNPMMNGQMNINASQTVPRKPRQNGYLNELSLLPTDLIIQKNAYADATNPNLMMKKDDTFDSNITNIYSSIEEMKEIKESYKQELEKDFKNFSDNFDITDLKTPTTDNKEPFGIPEDNDSVDLQFTLETKKMNDSNNLLDDDDFMHYDKPRSPATRQVNNRPTYEVPRPLNREPVNDLTKKMTNNSNELPTSHDNTLASNTSYYETIKK